MNRRMNSWLVAALVCGLSLSVTSCKDDDDNGGDYEVTPINLTIDKDLTTYGVETEVESAIVKVPVKCDGGWAAYLTDDPEWVAMEGSQVLFEGNQTLSLRFDENRTGADRTTTLKIVTYNGDETLVPVRQTQKYRGHDATNAYSQWFGNNGLGRGYNFVYVFEGDTVVKHQQKFSPDAMCMPNPIFNWAKIEELQQTYDSIKADYVLSKSAYVENTRQTIDYHDVPRDSSVFASDTLSVKLDLSMAFGFMEFEGHGQYDAYEAKGAAKLNYLFNRSATVYDAFVSPSELSTVANKIGGVLDDEGLEEQYKRIEQQEKNFKSQNLSKYSKLKKLGRSVSEDKLTGEYLEDWQIEVITKALDALDVPDYGGIFTESFGKIYFQLTRFLQSGDTKRAEATVEDLDAKFGPLFVSRGWYGGNILMRALVDTTYLDTYGHFYGSIRAEMENLFSMEGEIKYSEQAKRIVHNGDLLIQVYGGEAVRCGNKLAAHFNSETMTDRTELLDILEEWGNSLMEGVDESGNTEGPIPCMQHAQLTGIWTLFEDVETAKYVREYMYKKHPLLSKYLGATVD